MAFNRNLPGQLTRGQIPEPKLWVLAVHLLACGNQCLGVASEGDRADFSSVAWELGLLPAGRDVEDADDIRGDGQLSAVGSKLEHNTR